MSSFDKELIKLTEEDINKITLLQEDSDEAIVCRNFQGVITSFNKGAEKLYGYIKEEVIGNYESICTHQQSKIEFNNILIKVNNGIRIKNYEILRKKKNGEFITVLISVYPITHDEKIVGSVGFSRDVIKNEVYKLAIEGGNFGIWDWEIKSNKVYYSNRWKEMLGYNNGEIGNNYEDWIEIIHKEDIDSFKNKVNRHFKGEEYVIEYRLKCKDGNYKWVRTRGKVIKWDNESNPLRMTGTNEDINEEIISRKIAKENENRIIGIYNSVSAGIAHGEIILDSFGNPINYKCLHMNNYMEKIFGVKFENISKDNSLKVLPKNGKNWLTMFGQASLHGENFMFEDYDKARDKCYNVNIYSPNPMQFAFLVTDITENKRREIALTEKYEELQAVYEELTATEEELRANYKELEKANEKVEKANKAKSQFLTNVSHELRTPLNGILGCTQLLKLSKLSEEQFEDIIIIEKSSNHLLKLINDILDLSKIEAGKVELNYKRFNFLEQMDYVIKDLNLLIMGKDIEIMYYIDPFINKELIGDSFRLKQILNNLISNAVKFTDQGHIFFKVKQISKTTDETKLKFIIEDTGKGIEEDFKLDIFDKFTQEELSYTKNYGGTGLGLAISKELVEMMGGNINFESEVNKGSIFYFTAIFKNITNANYTIDNKKRSYSYKNVEKYKKVLVVEDNEINLKIAIAFLKQLNYKYSCVHNGQEAIDYLENNKVDIILMDVQMPILNGYDATRIIRDKESKSGEHIIIIAMTAHAMDCDKKKLINCGIDDYISKPYDIETLDEILEKFLSND